ncbi:cAMP phosphodiesterases class-II-domain-containing protein [Flagelloscypha sp. PMI_526]|nr:cAMP phosphodiesterases class-II-domain-containing protein [Flagelloscypha sp. PMI_526]
MTPGRLLRKILSPSWLVVFVRQTSLWLGTMLGSVRPVDELEAARDCSAHSFDFIVVGAGASRFQNLYPGIHLFRIYSPRLGGGPLRRHLSAYLLKPSHTFWEDGIVALEAGAGIDDLDSLLRADRSFLALPGQKSRHGASKMYSFVKSFVITHSHLDHINALVLHGGAFPGPAKSIYALRKTLVDLQTHIFNDAIWPNLACWDTSESRLENASFVYKQLQADGVYHPLHPVNLRFSIRTFILNHGHNTCGPYNSSGHLIRNDITGKEIMFFGDTEKDSPSHEPRLQSVWDAISTKIPSVLSSIFIECSYPMNRPENQMYGHFCPEHLCEEFVKLARAVSGDHELDLRPRKKARVDPTPPKRLSLDGGIDDSEDLRGALAGLTIPFPLDESPDDSNGTAYIGDVIAKQVTELMAHKELGLRVVALRPGMHLRE